MVSLPNPASFHDPLLLRPFLATHEDQYSEQTINLRELQLDRGQVHAASKTYHCSQSLLDELEDISGFSKLWKQVTASSRFSGPEEALPTKGAYLSDFLAEQRGKVRVLTYGNEVVSVTPASKTTVAPARILMWISILAHQAGIETDVEEYSPEKGLSVIFRQGPKNFSPVVGDPYEAFVRVTYLPSKRRAVEVSAEALRLVCTNGMVAHDLHSRTDLKVNYDPGASRRRLEIQIQEGLKELAMLPKRLQRLAGDRAPFTTAQAQRWLVGEPIHVSLRSRIVNEFEESSHKKTHYSFFNSITSSRNQKPELDSSGVSQLNRTAGRFLNSYSNRLH